MGASNLQRLKAAYKSWNDTKGGSVDAWLDLCAPDVTFISSGGGRRGLEFSAPCTCLEDVARYLTQLNDDWEMIHFTYEDFVGEGDLICASGSTAWIHKGTGKTADVLKADVWTFRGGKAVRIIEHFDTLALIEAATPDQ